MDLSADEKGDDEKFFLKVENQLLRKRLAAQQQEATRLRAEQQYFSDVFLRMVLAEGKNAQLDRELESHAQAIEQLNQQFTSV